MFKVKYLNSKIAVDFKKVILFFIGFMLITKIIYTQQDTLAKYNARELLTKAQLCLRGNPAKTIIYCDYTIKISQDENNAKITCSAKYLEAEAYRIQGNLNDALVSILEAKMLSDKVNIPALTMEIYTEMGAIYADRGEYDKVIPYYNLALDLAEKSEFKFSEMSIQYSIAYFKNSIGKHDESKAILKAVRKKYKGIKTNDNPNSRDAFEYQYHLLMGKIFIDSEQYDSAFSYVNYINDNYEEMNDLFSGQFSHSCLSEIYAQKKEFKKAEYHINIADSLSVAMGNKLTIMSIQYYAASLEFHKENYNNVISILKEVVRKTELENLNYEEREKVYHLLAKAYKETKQFDKASLAFEKYIDEHKRKNLNIDILDSDFKKREQAQFQLEIEDVKNENQFFKGYIRNLILGGLSIILLLLVALLWFYSGKKKNASKFEKLLIQINEAKDPNVINTKDQILEEKNTLEVNIETTNAILLGLRKLEEEDYFLETDCNSYNVAKKINTNTTYLSKVINAEFKKNFNTYINDLRINYAVIRLKNDPRFRSYTIQSIANDLGYKSADSFTKYFKKHTGLLPSFYIKQLELLRKK